MARRFVAPPCPPPSYSASPMLSISSSSTSSLVVLEEDDDEENNIIGAIRQNPMQILIETGRKLSSWWVARRRYDTRRMLIAAGTAGVMFMILAVTRPCRSSPSRRPRDFRLQKRHPSSSSSYSCSFYSDEIFPSSDDYYYTNNNDNNNNNNDNNHYHDHDHDHDTTQTKTMSTSRLLEKKLASSSDDGIHEAYAVFASVHESQ